MRLDEIKTILTEASSEEMLAFRKIIKQVSGLETYPTEDIILGSGGHMIKVSIEEPFEEDFFDTEAATRLENLLIKRMRKLGYKVTEVKITPTEISGNIVR